MTIRTSHRGGTVSDSPHSGISRSTGGAGGRGGSGPTVGTGGPSYPEQGGSGGGFSSGRYLGPSGDKDASGAYKSARIKSESGETEVPFSHRPSDLKQGYGENNAIIRPKSGKAGMYEAVSKSGLRPDEQQSWY
jgi:hypothetical protein